MSHTIYTADIKDWAVSYVGPKFHALLSDPPYELGFMGRDWDKSGIAFDPAMWGALATHLLPGAHVLAFSGTRTYHRMACAIEDAGLEIRDMLEWVYGQGMPKHRTTLKPAHEPICAARVPVDKATGFNIDACRVPATPGDYDHPGRARAIHGQESVCYGGFKNKHSQCKPNPQGRWPANLILDDSPEVAAMFPETKSGARNGIKLPRGYNGELYGFYKGGSSGNSWDSNSGSAARFFYQAQQDALDSADPLHYCGKAASSERHAGVGRNVHPCVKPLQLCTYLAKLLLPPPGAEPRRILVPFSGSGSEVIGAMFAGWDEVVGVELLPEHSALAEARIQHHLGLFAR